MTRKPKQAVAEKTALPPSEAAPEPVIIAYKGFDAQLRCKGYQFKTGEIFTHDGPVKACESGFHSCENPLDVFGYYDPATSIFAEIEASGTISRHDGDSKIASARVRVRAILSLPDFIGRAFDWVKAHCDPATSAHADKDRSASSATGESSASSATGNSSASSATGDRSASLTTGAYSQSEITPDTEGKPLQGVAVAAGYQNRARAPLGNVIVLIERDDEGVILHARASKVGENGVAADVWYVLRNGEFERAEDRFRRELETLPPATLGVLA